VKGVGWEGETQGIAEEEKKTGGGGGATPVLERYVTRSGNAIHIHSLNSFRESGKGFSSVTRSIVGAGATTLRFKTKS